MKESLDQDLEAMICIELQRNGGVLEAVSDAADDACAQGLVVDSLFLGTSDCDMLRDELMELMRERVFVIEDGCMLYGCRIKRIHHDIRSFLLCKKAVKNTIIALSD